MSKTTKPANATKTPRARKSKPAAAPVVESALVPMGELIMNETPVPEGIEAQPANDEANEPAPVESFPVALVTGETAEPVETITVDAVLTQEEFEALQVETIEPAPEVIEPIPTGHVVTGAALIVNALRSRPQVSNDIDTAVSGILRAPNALNALYERPEWVPVLDALADRIKIADKGNRAFIAVKTAVKLVHAAEAIAMGMRGAFDPYSQVILKNLANQLCDDGMTMRSMQVALSKKCTYGALDKQQTLTYRYDCSVGTASTQASSTRMMLEAFGLCIVHKGKIDDLVQWADNERADTVRALFKV